MEKIREAIIKVGEKTN
jgi:lysosomal acid lipase/cholesteryl ester hydrolase